MNDDLTARFNQRVAALYETAKVMAPYLAVRNQPVRQDVAMTGEITLSGLVLPVGGIREKAMAARRFGVKTFILPALNEPDLEELPEEIRRDMTFVPVETLEQVVKVAMADQPVQPVQPVQTVQADK